VPVTNMTSRHARGAAASSTVFSASSSGPRILVGVFVWLGQ